jgi:hypothetical protein
VKALNGFIDLAGDTTLSMIYFIEYIDTPGFECTSGFGGNLLDYFLSCLFLYTLTRLKVEEVYFIPQCCQLLTVHF